MLDFIKAPQLPPQLHWKRAKEPELLMWTIRARNYNTFVANTMFCFCFFVIAVIAFFIYRSLNDDPVYGGMLAAVYFVIVCVALVSMTHQRMNYAYRFTCSGVEYCKWKSPPKWMLTFLKWFAGISAIAFIFLATIDPTFLIGALVGPGSMGLMYLSMANSKGFQNIHTEYHHHFMRWSDFVKATIATNRDVVDVKYFIEKEKPVKITRGNLYMFFKRQGEDRVVACLKTYLPSVTPLVIGRVDVLN
jgi:hypothetical protein